LGGARHAQGPRAARAGVAEHASTARACRGWASRKGNPVKQYEPFFSATGDFEDEDAIVATGVTPIIHYDPLDRVIRTELPDGSESRVEFDAWVQRTFDPNDAVVGTLWLTQHQAGTPDQQRAATLALAHADTPTIAHLDSLGRTFLVQTDNGPDPATPAGTHRLYDTRTQFDIEGNVLAITDARGVQVIQQRFDVLQRRLRVDSPDAGARLAVADVAGKPLRAWDSRAQTMRSRYDALQRPTHMFVAVGASERLLLRTVFGESLDPPGVPTPVSPAQALNLRGRPYLSFDCAGLVTAESFDFKGNLLASSRRLAADYTTEPNWTATENLTDPAAILTAASPLLETEHFDNSSTFDALNRVTTHTTPDGSVTTPKYNEANLLESLLASVPGGPDQDVITNLDYNARGQRISCQYGNGTTTTYTYDPKTFRLTELQTLRGATKLQWLLYTFDPVGNIVALRDQSDTGPIFSGTAPVSGDGLYEYDPLYRLLKATGREHPATQPIETDPPLGTGVPHANDLQALIAYSETYVYDKVGNIEQMAHVAGPSGSLGWTRNYKYATNSNRLEKTSVPGSPLNLIEPYTYDQHGSMTSMPRLPVMDWDYADRLRHTQKGAGSGAQDTYFTYDAAGQRVRKVAIASGGVKERIYLGGYEVYRERAAAPGAPIDFERQTLHVMDDQRRVAMAETKTIDGGAVVPTLTTRWRFQLDNHLGSATLELDDAGSVISYEEYHPYGSTAFHTANGAAQVSAKRYRYTGKEKDEETGLYYHGARYYAPWLGRWTAADPIGISGGINLYRYAAANPINSNDPRGTQPFNSSKQSCLPEPEVNSSTSTESEQQASSVTAHKADVQRAEDVQGYQALKAQAQLIKEGKAQLPPFDAKAWEKKIVATLRQTTTEKHKLTRQLEQAEDAQKADAEAKASAYREQQEAIEKDSPSTAAGLVPVVGEGRTSYAHFVHGDYVGGTLHLGLAISDVGLVKSVVAGGAKLTLKLAPVALGAAKSTATPRLALKITEEGGEVLRFAHGTSPESAESVVKGLSAEAAAANTKGGTALAPGSFFAHEIGPASAPGEGLQLAYEWGLRHSPTPAVVIGELPGAVAKKLLKSGGLRVLDVPGMQGIPQLVFDPKAFKTVNDNVKWLQVLTF
jgi:RHS repeat-associated protein